jgi:hypothetical protein
VLAVAFGILPDGRVLLASGGQDNTVRLWDPENPAVGELHIYRVAPSTPAALCFEHSTVYIGCSHGLIALDIASVISPA